MNKPIQKIAWGLALGPLLLPSFLTLAALHLRPQLSRWAAAPKTWLGCPSGVTRRNPGGSPFHGESVGICDWTATHRLHHAVQLVGEEFPVMLGGG